MGLRMENFNILGFHWKIQLLGGSSQKTNIEGVVGLPKKGGLGQFADLRDLARKRGWCFWGGVDPWCTLWVSISIVTSDIHIFLSVKSSCIQTFLHYCTDLIITSQSVKACSK